MRVLAGSEVKRPTFTLATVTPGAITTGFRAASGAATPSVTARRKTAASRRFMYRTIRDMTPNVFPSRGSSGVLHPILREQKPEGQARVGAVAAEARLDLPIGRLATVHARVFGTCPGVEDQPRVAAEKHHHVGRCVGADAGKRKQPRGHLFVGEVVRGRVAQLLQVERARGGVGGERAEVGAAIPGAHDVPVKG